MARRTQTARLKIAIVGAGNLGNALAMSLREAGYPISEIVSRPTESSWRQAQRLAQRVGARAAPLDQPGITASVVWLCVPDQAIASCARKLASTMDWTGKVALHSSGALTNDELRSLAQRGAKVASAHPLMTFVPGVTPSLSGVGFAVEGDRKALMVARKIVHDLGGQIFSITARQKVAYHAWGAFASPLLTSLLALTERVAGTAGINPAAARRRVAPILLQTVENYIQRGARAGFSGPIIRGDSATVRKHLAAIKRVPDAEDVYRALARSALRTLPAKNRKELKKVLT